jgi:hypothetical protein
MTCLFVVFSSMWLIVPHLFSYRKKWTGDVPNMVLRRSEFPNRGCKAGMHQRFLSAQ